MSKRTHRRLLSEAAAEVSELGASDVQLLKESLEVAQARLSAIKAADHWDQLAKDALRQAEWDEAHVGSGAPQRNKADSYRRTARAIRLSIETGQHHCACCLKPKG